MKTVIHPDFISTAPFVHAVPRCFGSMGRPVHGGRNDVRAVDADGLKFAVKSYRKITFANRIIYALFRKSKAQRAYENALTLLGRGIMTPQPVAYINCYSGFLLEKSYFISLYVDHSPLKDIAGQPLPESRDSLIAFARFVHILHRKGVFHDDFNMSNILCKSASKSYEFCLIDNNRIRFRKPTQNRMMRNLRRINLPVEKYAVVAGEYARLSHADAYNTISLMLLYRQVSICLRDVKYFFKRIFGKGSRNGVSSR